MGDLTILIPITLFVVIGYIIRTIVHNRRLNEVARIQSEMQTRLLEKFGTAEDMRQYLESAAGRRFVESATLERSNPHGRILGSIQAGLLFIACGIGLYATRHVVNDGQEGFYVLGVLGMLVGAGFLASSFLSYRLSKAWGLLPAGTAGEN
jgi:hypothetical protein